MEQWLLANLFQIIVIVIGGIIAFVKLNQFQVESIKWREDFSRVIRKMETDLAHHIESPTPHPACPAHEAILLQVKEVLGQMHMRIGSMDDRWFARINELENRIFAVIRERNEGGK